MTREEAIEIFENKENYVGIQHIPGADVYISRGLAEAINVVLTALRPVSRERVEKVWRGEWEFPIFKDGDANDPRCKCSECGSVETPLARHRFCPSCGAPMMDEAVGILLKRLEALHENIYNG